MTKPRDVEGWKVRVVMRGGGSILHFVSRTMPDVIRGVDGRVREVRWDLTDEGDTAGFIDWAEAVAITWRGEGRA